MRRSNLTGVAAALVLFALTVAPAAAQQPTRPLTADRNQWLVGLGVSFLNVADETGFGFGANALFNRLKTKISDNSQLGILGDVGWNHFDGGSIFTLDGGVRMTFNTKNKLRPYGQFLLGLAHSSFGPGDTDFAPAFGFGLDLAWTPRVNFRGEVQFYLTDETATRWFFGISLPIKQKI
jgi:Outer membrane protein beta-barrel domain